MYCPQCSAEFRPGFTHCRDCDADLVEHLPPAPPPAPSVPPREVTRYDLTKMTRPAQVMVATAALASLAVLLVLSAWLKTIVSPSEDGSYPVVLFRLPLSALALLVGIVLFNLGLFILRRLGYSIFPSASDLPKPTTPR